MDAVEFIKTKNMICKQTSECNYCIIPNCPRMMRENPEEIVAIVEKWAKGNPVQTNADKFKEVFGMPPAPGYGGWWDEPYKVPKEE